MSAREILASAARTSTGAGGAEPVQFGSEKLAIAIDVTAVSGTTPSMTNEIEWSTDGGVTWFKGETPDTFAAITAAKKTIKLVDVKAPHYRVLWTITGTTPSFTFAVDEAAFDA